MSPQHFNGYAVVLLCHRVNQGYLSCALCSKCCSVVSFHDFSHWVADWCLEAKLIAVVGCRQLCCQAET